MQRLRLEQEGQSPLILDGNLITIGRSDSNLVLLADSRISSVHGEIVRRAGGYYYRDLGSTNGSMVRSRGRNVVVDGKRVREVHLADGDQLLLGDRVEPVVIQVGIQQIDRAAKGGSTIVARRSTASVALLGSQIVENPLASRQTLNRLFNFFGELGELETPKALASKLSNFVLDLIPKNQFVGTYLFGEEGLERSALVARDPARTPVISSEELARWFPDVFEGTAAMVMEVPAKEQKRFSQLEMLAAAPLPVDSGVVGVTVVGRSVGFSDFDLDLLSLVGQHAALHLQKLDLIEKLEHANRSLAEENRDLREQLDETIEDRPMIGESPTWKRVLRQAELVAEADTAVLLLGETGTGKELVSRHIHKSSNRNQNRFAAVNCGALAESLLESELFGHVKGAFTGADQNKMGLFEAADGGTLFLDEIGDVTPGLQVKLLRVLEAKEVTPVGGNNPIKVDVRVIAATHRALEQEVTEGRFREDLYYRIAVFPIQLPTLKERHGDIPLLADHFLEFFNERMVKNVTGFTEAAITRLERFNWPGNVRQLQNEIHRAVLLADDNKPISDDELSDRVSGVSDVTGRRGPLKQVVGQFEEQYIRKILREHSENRTHTAKFLGISRQALTEKLRKYKQKRAAKDETVPA